MKKVRNRFIKSTVVGVIACAVLASQASLAQAAVSETAKAKLDEIISMMSGYGDITEAITYIYSGYVKNLTAENVGASTPILTPTPSSLLCTYARGLAKNLDVGMNDPQVQTLQKYFNTLAKDNTVYRPVTTRGEGSSGFETTYYGGATQAAVTRWQAKNMTGADYTPGVLDEDTRAKMVSTCENLAKGTTTPKPVVTTPKNGVTTSPVNQTDTQVSGAGSMIPGINTTSLVKPLLEFDKTSVSKGEKVSYTVELRNYGTGTDGCRMIKKFINQGSATDNTIFSKNSGTYVDYPQLTTEYYISCNVAGQTVESEHTTVVVDGVTPGAAVGTGTQSISLLQNSDGEYGSYLMSGGAYRYFFTINSNAASGSTVYFYYGSSNSSCTSLPNKVSTSNTLSSYYSATVAASALQTGQTYYFCAAAVTSNGTVSAETPVGSFVAK